MLSVTDEQARDVRVKFGDRRGVWGTVGLATRRAVRSLMLHAITLPGTSGRRARVSRRVLVQESDGRVWTGEVVVCKTERRRGMPDCTTIEIVENA